jgi:hypothetical protein
MGLRHIIACSTRRGVSCRPEGLLVFVGLLFLSPPVLADFSQQGPKLVAADAIGGAQSLGVSVALSRDGNIAIVGGNSDNNNRGAAWIYARNSGVWTQRAKLVGTGAIDSPNPAHQGDSVALSTDGKMAFVGGRYDNGGIGALWVYAGGSNTWMQIAKLVGTGAIGSSLQGQSVALSSQGDTVIVGGFGDNNNKGAAWIFTRGSGGIWTQQAKLFDVGVTGEARQGCSVALSADGDTAIVGGNGDNSATGAAWIYLRNAGTWLLQAKLVATNAPLGSEQGNSVALSADGRTAIVGAPSAWSNYGAAWIFVRGANGLWTESAKLHCKAKSGFPIGPSFCGYSVSLSSAGDAAILGGYVDNGDVVTSVGAAWSHMRGSGGAWIPGKKLIGMGWLTPPRQGYSVGLAGDGKTAIIGGPRDSPTGSVWFFRR